MCRILFARGTGRDVAPLFEALMKSAEMDPYREKKDNPRHPDGWGYVLLRGDEVVHYRSALPMFDDPNAKNLLDSLGEEDSEVVLMAHARAASQGRKTIFNVQPFQFSTKRGFTFWFMHNGDLNKEAIIEKSGFLGGWLTDASDSYVLAAYLSEVLEDLTPSNLLRRFSIGVETTNGVLNTGTLFLLPDGSWRAFITAYMTDEYLNNVNRWNYARLIGLREKEVYAVASSTLEVYYRAGWRTIDNGTALVITPDKVERLSLGDVQ